MSVIHENDLQLQEDITLIVSRTGDLKTARRLYDEYIMSGRHIEHAGTMYTLAMLWRELKDETRLMGAIRDIESCADVTDDHRANVQRELMLLWAKRFNRRDRARAAQLMKRVRELRNDPQQRIVDTTANAKRLLYAGDLSGALEQIKEAQELLWHAFNVVEQDAKHHAWWSLEIAELNGDDVLARHAASWLLGGRQIRRVWVRRESKPSRVHVARTLSKLQKRGDNARLARRSLAQAALLYDRLR